MNEDRIAEIRARHDAVSNVLRGASQMHDDRGYLLAKVERLRAEMLDLAEWCESEEPLSHKKLSQRLRAALEGKP